MGGGGIGNYPDTNQLRLCINLNIYSLSLSTPGTSWKGEGRGGENFSLIENIDFVATFHIRHILRLNSKQIDGDLGHYNTVVDSF